MKKIPVGSLFALVDDEDFDRLSKVSWSLQSTGYPQAWWDGHTRTMHQAVLDLKPGYRGKVEVSHENQDKLDNRKSNLVIADRQHNSRNQTHGQKNSTHGYLNVKKQTNGYSVEIFGQYIGFRKNLEDAAKLARETRQKMLNMS